MLQDRSFVRRSTPIFQFDYLKIFIKEQKPFN